MTKLIHIKIMNQNLSIEFDWCQLPILFNNINKYTYTTLNNFLYLFFYLSSFEFATS